MIWKTPGGPPGYGSLILGTFGGVRQIVGHDADSLGGWDPNTGQRLWTLVPEKKGDYNVPTPIDVFGRLLVATENNGTRLYNFSPNGQIRPVPVEQTHALAPDTSTPVVVDGLVFGCFHGLFCLDPNDRPQDALLGRRRWGVQGIHLPHRRPRPGAGRHRRGRVGPLPGLQGRVHAHQPPAGVRETPRSGRIPP